MRRAVLDWCRPLSVWVLVAVAVVTFASTVLSTADVFRWAPPLWVRVSLGLREGSYVAGLATAVLAAGCASAIGSSSLIGGPGRARTGWATTTRHASRLVAAAWAGATLGLALTLPVAAVRATAGHLDVLALAEGYLVTGCWILVGYAIGAVLPGGWAQSGAFGVAAATWVLPNLVRTVPLFAVFPVWSLDWPYLGDTLVPLTSLFRVVFFAGFGMTLVLFAARVAERNRYRPVGGLVNAGWLLLPVLLVACLVLWQRPPLVEVERNAPIECARTDAATVCLHAGLVPLLGSATDATSAVARVRRAAEPVEVVENSASTEHPSADLVIRADLSSRVRFGDDWASQTAFLLAGAGVCENAELSGEEVLDRMITTEAIAHELVVRAGYGFVPRTATSDGALLSAGSPLADQLAAMTTPELMGWFQAHDSEIRTCALGGNR